jgi:hypothetical protein
MRLLSMERPCGTTDQYDRKVRLWLEFNAIGHRGRPTNPLVGSASKWRLFAGWLYARSVDKDLNGFRSAVNRYMEDNGAARALLGHSVNTINLRYHDLQVARKIRRGEEPNLNRVPCPEIALRRLVQLGRAAEGEDLFWVCCLLVMMLCWFRAATMAMIQPGDVRFGRDGTLLVSVRGVKGRPAFLTQPALIQIKPARPGHPRHEVFAVLHRLLDADPNALAQLGRRVSPRARGGEAAAALLTGALRRLVPAHTLNLPVGAIVASHSLREMGATTAALAGYSATLACAHGLWRRVATMHDNYVFSWFPFSPWLARVLDFLRSR